jgi:hypothetical protein
MQQENRLLREEKLGSGQLTGFNYLLIAFINRSGGFDPEITARTLDTLVLRHEALRTSYRRDGDGFVQVVDPAPRPVEVHRAELADKDEAIDFVRHNLARPFPADCALFLRAGLVSRTGDGTTLVLVTDHIAVDAVGLQVLRRDFAEVYDALEAGAAVSPDTENRLQPIEWSAAQWAHLRDHENDIVDFWRARLEPDGPFPQYDVFDPREGVERAAPDAVRGSLAAHQIADVDALAERYDVTRFTATLAVVQVALTAVLGRDGIVVHSATANRTTEAEMAMVGWTAHGLPFRYDLEDAVTLGHALSNARAQALAILKHQDLPLTRIVKAIAPTAHGSARGLRPPRFYLGYYERGEAEGVFDLDESDFHEAVNSAQPGLSIDITYGVGQADVHIHFGKGRFARTFVRAVLSAITGVIELGVHEPDISVQQLANQFGWVDN